MPGRVPGPIGMDGVSTPRIDSGTAARTNTPAPGGIGGPSGVNTGGYQVEMHEVGWMDMADAAQAIWSALRASRALVGSLVLEETGVAVAHIMEGLLPGLMMAIGVMAGTTLLGAAVGALIGTLAGGIGAAPGAIIGGQLGYDLGMAAMALLGLGFLVHGIAQGMPQIKLYAERATKRAVNSLYVPVPQQRSEINLAARDFAHAQALLFKLVLMALVALLLKKPTAASVRGLASSARGAAGAVRAGETVAAAEAGVAEIVAQLRASRLGQGFATWVEANWRELIENPKLRPQVKPAAGAVRSSEALTPSQLARRNQPAKPTSTEPEVRSSAGPKSAQKPKVRPAVEELNPNDVRFSQKSVSYQKIDRTTGEPYTQDDLVRSMKEGGWTGEPVDVVKMPDGKLTSVDNTRILAAREAGIDVQANVRNFNEPLTPEMKSARGWHDYDTWGEAITGRIEAQGGKFNMANPNGAGQAPRVTGRPTP